MNYYAKSLLMFICRDAWNAIGDMSKEDAMQSYVNELKQVGDET